MRVAELVLAAALIAAGIEGVAAQAPPPPGVPNRPPPEPRLTFEREVFTYPSGGRRDPFVPLSGQDAIGPVFDDFSLRGIVYSRNPAQSLAIINDGTRRPKRLRRGESLGNARVIAIENNRVRFMVENYGIQREEVLELAQRQLPPAESNQPRTLEELLTEQLLRGLRGDTVQGPAVQGGQTRPPPARRDTIQTPPARPRGND